MLVLCQIIFADDITPFTPQLRHQRESQSISFTDGGGGRFSLLMSNKRGDFYHVSFHYCHHIKSPARI